LTRGWASKICARLRELEIVGKPQVKLAIPNGRKYLTKQELQIAKIHN
jgi:hypothetical protein